MLEYIKIINCVKFYFINLDLIVIIGVDKKVIVWNIVIQYVVVKFDVVIRDLFKVVGWIFVKGSDVVCFIQGLGFFYVWVYFIE